MGQAAEQSRPAQQHVQQNRADRLLKVHLQPTGDLVGDILRSAAAAGDVRTVVCQDVIDGLRPWKFHKLR